MPEPIRSPKQSKVVAKARSNPYPRTRLQRVQQDVNTIDSITPQSSSLLGAIKNLVTAPFSWLSAVERRTEDNDFVPKRKDPFERSGTPPKSKRVRRDSLDAKNEDLVYRKLITPLLDFENGVSPGHSQRNNLRKDLIYRAPSSPVLRDTAQSVEPLDFKLNNIHICRSTTRERSMPPPSPFARSFSRVSLTPQPSGATFGPSPKRKQRDLTAPPSNSRPFVPHIPVFTRPPSVPPSLLFPKSPTKQISEGPIMSLLTQSKLSLSPGSDIPSMLTASDVHPVSPSKVERTLSTLETYRTPLSLFPSQSYPEDRRPRKVHVPLPSKQSPFDEFRKKKLHSVAPYPTETLGLRKLLQRNKPENDAQDTVGEKMTAVDVQFVGSLKKKAEANIKDISEVATTSAKSSIHSPKSDSYSSLRAPAMKLRRAHISAPQSKKPRNKFSLKGDDDETILSVSDLKAFESKMPKPHLSFTRRMSEAGMQTEVSVSTPPATTPLSPSAKSSLTDEQFSEATPYVISNSNPKWEEAFRDHSKQENTSVAESTVKQAVVSAPKSASSVLPSNTTPISLPSSVPPNDVVSSKPFASISLDMPSMKPITSPSSFPSFFSSAKTDFSPPPLPTVSIFTDAPSITQIGVIERPLEMNTNGDSVASPAKLPIAASLETAGSSMKPMKELLFDREQKASMTTFSTSQIDAVAPAPTDITTSTSVEATEAATPDPAPISFVFGQDTAKKPAPSSLPSSPVVSPFTFGSPLPSSTGNSEFAFSKLPAERIAKPVNVFNFEPATSSALPHGSQTQASLALPGSTLSTDLAGSISAETDTQMDTNDQMEESPKRVQEKKDAAGLLFSPSLYNVSAPTSNPPFSFSSSPSKSSNTSFTFGEANTTISHSNSDRPGVFSFGSPKAASAGSTFGFSNANSMVEGSNFNFFSKPPDSLSSSPFAGTTLTTSTSAPVFTFGTSFGQFKADKPVPNGNSAPNSPGLFPRQNMSPTPSFSFAFPGSPTATKPDIPNLSGSPSQPFQFGVSSLPSSQQQGAMFTLGAATSTTPRKLKGLPQRRRK